MSELFEYLVVTTDHKSFRIMADSIKGVLEAIDEEETPILNIFRNVAVSEGTVAKPAKVSTKVSPAVASDTGCRSYPVLPVETRQGKAITLSAVAGHGWEFEGWYLEDKKVGADLQATIINEAEGEAVYTAKFTPKSLFDR